MLRIAFLWAIVATLTASSPVTEILGSGVTNLVLNSTENGIIFNFLRDDLLKLKGTIGIGIDFTNLTDADFELNVVETDNGFYVQWISNNSEFEAYDCIDLQKKDNLHWYGGPQIYQQEWPIEKLNLSGNDPYVVRKDLNFAVPERYWLNSKGGFIYVDEKSPLFVDQNILEDGKACFIAKISGPYFNRTRLYHKYHLIALDDPVSAHKFALTAFLKQPTSLPNRDMMTDPIWTTWAKYKKNISDSIVRDFTNEIENHGFKGQIEIDEKWETCFGSRKFIPDQFGNISNVINDIKNRGFRVTLWAAPFINPDCTELIEEGEAKGYYVKNMQGNMTTVWWESTDARQIDFTNPVAQKWYSDRLSGFFKDPGVDGFKFDAGEIDYVAQPAVYENVDQELIPNILTQNYIKTISQFGDLIEARSAFKTQNYSLYLRMIDKDSVWGLDDGLQSLVTTLLQLNMAGYSFILPDMIGGNAYRAQPTLELIIRWTQATVFMPVMQFSFLPWDFQEDEQLNATEIVRAMVNLHYQYVPNIVEAMERTLSDQIPTNPPIWWIASTDEVALKTFDEYLLGENILVAPVMEEGVTSRNVYLPNGTWIDGNDPTVKYTGPINFKYEAPLSILPYFILSN